MFDSGLRQKVKTDIIYGDELAPLDYYMSISSCSGFFFAFFFLANFIVCSIDLV